MQDLPADAPAALQVSYTYSNQPTQTWHVQAVGPATNRSVIVVDAAVDLINEPNVTSRKLLAHYPTSPIPREFVISSVLPALLLEEEMTDDSPTLKLGATPYSVTINMPQATVDALTNGNYQLYGFKAVKTTGTGVPSVWFETESFGLKTKVNWTESYQAYTSTQDFQGLTQITATNAYGIDLNQTLNVKSKSGTGAIDTQTGVKSAISIYNEVAFPFTCGISQLQNGSYNPLCAFPLYGGGLDIVAPIAQVLLMFSTAQLNTGAVIFKAFSPGLLIDLTEDNAQTVNYDINLGWSWGGGPWAQKVKASSNLVPLLIQGSKSLNESYAKSLAQASAE